MKFRLAIAGLVTALAVLVMSARAAEPAAAGTASAPDGPATGAAGLPADPALKAGMKAIRDATLDVHTLVTHRRMPEDRAQSYAAAVKRQADVIRSGASAREASVAAEVETLMSEIAGGAEAVAGRGGDKDPIDGIIAVGEALERYGARFSDPDWKPLR